MSSLEPMVFLSERPVRLGAGCEGPAYCDGCLCEPPGACQGCLCTNTDLHGLKASNVQSVFVHLRLKAQMLLQAFIDHAGSLFSGSKPLWAQCIQPIQDSRQHHACVLDTLNQVMSLSKCCVAAARRPCSVLRSYQEFHESDRLTCFCTI